MKNWMHFIGRQYYPTIQSFVDEAQKFGVSRRIAPNMAKAMNFGDRVWLFYSNFWRGRSTLFGYFTITSVWGKYPDAMIQELEQEGKIEKKMDALQSVTVTKGCGTFGLGAIYEVKATLPDLVRACERHRVESLMIGGSLETVEQIHTTIPHQQGFRRFDVVTFHKDVFNQQSAGRKRILVREQCFVPLAFRADEDEDFVTTTNKSQAFSIYDYQRKTDEQLKKEKGQA